MTDTNDFDRYKVKVLRLQEGEHVPKAAVIETEAVQPNHQPREVTHQLRRLPVIPVILRTNPDVSL